MPEMELNLKSGNDYKDLFKNSNSSNIKIVKLEISKLETYPEHPFSTDNEEQLKELAESIKENGLLNPIIVLEYEDEKYYILSGHRRTLAHKLLQKNFIDAIVKKDLTRSESDLIVIESNLKQREKLLCSEKARAYKMQMAALNEQGKRTDLELSFSPMEKKINSAKKISELRNESVANIYRYIALNNLIWSLLNEIDNETIPFRVGVELSSLNNTEQQLVYMYFIEKKKSKLDLKIATKLKEISKNKEITYIDLANLTNELTNTNEKNKSINIPTKKLNGLLKNVEDDKVVDYIIEAVKFYEVNKL